MPTPYWERYFSPTVYIALIVAAVVLIIAGIVGNAVVTHEHEVTKQVQSCATAHETWTGKECHQ